MQTCLPSIQKMHYFPHFQNIIWEYPIFIAFTMVLLESLPTRCKQQAVPQVKAAPLAPTALTMPASYWTTPPAAPAPAAKGASSGCHLFSFIFKLCSHLTSVYMWTVVVEENYVRDTSEQLWLRYIWTVVVEENYVRDTSEQLWYRKIMLQR